MQQLVGANHCLLKLSETFGTAELLYLWSRARGGSGSTDEGGRFKHIGLLIFVVLRKQWRGELERGGRAGRRGVLKREGGELFHRLQYNYYDGLLYAEHRHLGKGNKSHSCKEITRTLRRGTAGWAGRRRRVGWRGCGDWCEGSGLVFQGGVGLVARRSSASTGTEGRIRCAATGIPTRSCFSQYGRSIFLFLSLKLPGLMICRVAVCSD